VSSADDKRAELAARVRKLINWCYDLIEKHGQLIGQDAWQSKYPAPLTAQAFARLLVSVGLADHAAQLPLGAYKSHQDVIGLLNRYVPVLRQLDKRLADQMTASPMQAESEQQASDKEECAFDRIEKAAKVSTVADWCHSKCLALKLLTGLDNRESQQERDSVRRTLSRLLQEVSEIELRNLVWKSEYASETALVGLLARCHSQLTESADSIWPQSDCEASDSDITPTDSGPVSDNRKKPKKKRPMNYKAATCAKLYRKGKRRDPSASLQGIVEEYVQKHGGSISSILRTLNDNKEQWKFGNETEGPT